MKRLLFLLATMALFLPVAQAKTPVRKQLFDDNWQFLLGDSGQWRTLSLPHDWSIEGRFDPQAPAGNDGAYLPTGKGCYRKTLNLGKDYAGKTLRLYFEGAYMNSEVRVNGHVAGGHPYGYTSFFVDITPYIIIGRNLIEVSIDNSQQKNCRWYSGSGLYRHVWLLATSGLHLDEWGHYVRAEEQADGWRLLVDAPYTDTGLRPVLRHTLRDPEGNIVAQAQGEELSQVLTVARPRLWSPESPSLYRLTTQLVVDGNVADELTTTTAFRTIEYDSEHGLRLNHQPLVLNGGCVHHDNGMLGAAAFDRAEQRKALLLKQAGFNAVRTSHNPPSEAFLTACDELGLLVIDEAFDGWREAKNDHDYHKLIDRFWRDDLGAMVRRDRNHPSIFCWSIGNEVIERKKIEVVRTAQLMAQLCKALDEGRRPVTSALASWDSDWDIYDPLAAVHDIVGYNYMIHKSVSDHERVPQRVMMQTESYPRDAYKNYRKSHDEPYIVGDFVWTAIDYLGESGIGRWYYEGDPAGEHWERPLYPWHAAYCGDIDLTGLLKPIGHYRSMLWNETGQQLYMAVREPDGYQGTIKETLWGTWPTFESWNWPGHEGKSIEVEVSSRYPNVRLYLNDSLIGQQSTRQLQAVFALPYQPGTLRAEGLSATGEVMESTTLQTAGEATTLRLTPDHTTLAADGQDLVFVTIELTDSNGLVCPTANHRLEASVKGPATLVAFGNADIKDTDPYTASSHRAWKGRALLVLRAQHKAGRIELTVGGDNNLRPATLQLWGTTVTPNP